GTSSMPPSAASAPPSAEDILGLCAEPRTLTRRTNRSQPKPLTSRARTRDVTYRDALVARKSRLSLPPGMPDEQSRLTTTSAPLVRQGRDGRAVVPAASPSTQLR